MGSTQIPANNPIEQKVLVKAHPRAQTLPIHAICRLGLVAFLFSLGGVMDNKTYESLPLLMSNGQLSPANFITLENGVAPLARTGVLNGAGGAGGGAPHAV